MSENIATDFSSDDSIADATFSIERKLKRPILNVEASTSKKAKIMTHDSLLMEAQDDNFELSDELKRCSGVLLFKKYFKIIETLNNTEFERKRNGVVAECCICKSKLKGSTLITSNFVRHLKNKHSDQFNEKEKTSSQKTFNVLTMQFIAQNMLPLSIVDDKSFQNLITYLNSNMKLVCRQTATKLVDDMYSKMLASIKNTLKQCPYVCTTADIWSTKHKSFFGYTCHWIDESFQRKSIALACEIFKGSHTFDKFYDMIMKIHNDFGLSARNITATVTDNGSNFIKAFREFGLNTPSLIPNSTCEVEEVEDIEEMNALEISNHFFDKSLPKHIRCPTHTLNLVATTDLLRILKNDEHVYEKHKNIMKKCSGLWNKVNRPKTSEQIIAFLGSQLKYPVVTRLNSLFDSVQCLYFHREKINELCEKLETEKFHETDFKYLEEYLQILKPIADAIDLLQREDGMVFGLLLPTLATARTKFLKMQIASKFKYLPKIAAALEESLRNRFSSYFNLDADINDAIVASVLCPEVKLKWVKSINSSFDNYKVQKVNDLVEDIISKDLESTIDEGEDLSTLACTPSKIQLSECFDFSLAEDEFCQAKSPTSSVEEEFLAYLVDRSTHITMLDRYPNIKSAFIKYNATLPSSAPVERLFSFVSMLNTPRRGTLSDNSFEKLLLLKTNKIIA